MLVNWLLFSCKKVDSLTFIALAIKYMFILQDWGKLKEHSKASNAEFVESLGKFVGILSTARENMAGR